MKTVNTNPATKSQGNTRMIICVRVYTADCRRDWILLRTESIRPAKRTCVQRAPVRGQKHQFRKTKKRSPLSAKKNDDKLMLRVKNL